MFTRRQFLGLLCAPLVAKEKPLEKYGKVIYESPHPGKLITIIGTAHKIEDDVRKNKWKYIVNSQSQAYELLESELIEHEQLEREHKKTPLLLEGVWSDEKARLNKIEVCDPRKYKIKPLTQENVYSGCLQAGQQFALKNRKAKAIGWDHEYLSELAYAITMSDRATATRRTMSRRQARISIRESNIDIPYDVQDKALIYSFHYRSACLLEESMKHAPCISVAGALHLDEIIPMIENNRIDIKGVKSTVTDLDLPAVHKTIDTAPYHFRLIQTHASVEFINQLMNQQQ